MQINKITHDRFDPTLLCTNKKCKHPVTRHHFGLGSCLITVVDKGIVPENEYYPNEGHKLDCGCGYFHP